MFFVLISNNIISTHIKMFFKKIFFKDEEVKINIARFTPLFL